MKIMGYIFLVTGFIAAAFYASQDEQKVIWIYYSAGLVFGIFGIWLIRIGHKVVYHSDEKITARLEVIDSSLNNIAENIKRLNEQKTDIDTYDVRHRIDELFNEDFEKFVDSRQSISLKFGLQSYAEVMDHFAAGQRYINRVWSASTDGYIDEVNEYIEKARDEFFCAFEKFSELKTLN